MKVLTGIDLISLVMRGLCFLGHRVSAHFTTFFTYLVRAVFFAPNRARLLYLSQVLKGFTGSGSGTRLSLISVRVLRDTGKKP